MIRYRDVHRGALKMVLKVRREKSSSCTGKHAIYENAFIVTKNQVKEVEPYRKEKINPMYKKGEAYELYIKLQGQPEVYIAHVWFVRNLRKQVRGWIKVYDNEGTMRLKAVYRKLKIRRSKGDKNLEWVIKKIMDHLKLPVKRYNFNTGSD